MPDMPKELVACPSRLTRHRCEDTPSRLIFVSSVAGSCCALLVTTVRQSTRPSNCYWSEAGRTCLPNQARWPKCGVRRSFELRLLPGHLSTEVAEFYVQPANRRIGVGRSAALDDLEAVSPGRGMLPVQRTEFRGRQVLAVGSGSGFQGSPPGSGGIGS